MVVYDTITEKERTFLILAMQHLTSYGLSAKLICSPMEEECGIPNDYFDFVYSIYAVGWTTDVVEEDNTLAFKKCYFDESY